MLKNALYLIDTNTLGLIVTLFTVTINNNNNLILRYVKELGSLDCINGFIDNSLLAITQTEACNSDINYVVSIHKGKSVLAYDIEEPELIGKKINIIGKNMNVKKARKLPVTSNPYAISAVIGNANIQSENDIYSIIMGNKYGITGIYEFKGEEFNLENLPKEMDERFINLGINKFSKTWQLKMLNNMDEFFINENELLIPTVNGEWKHEYIEGVSFPYMKYFSKIPSKTEWKSFLKLPLKLLSSTLRDAS